MEGRSLVSVKELTKETVEGYLKVARKFEAGEGKGAFAGKIVATLFYEPSTRTRLSFEAAAIRGGASVIGFADENSSSVTKGETLKDTVRIVRNYADVIVMRHPIEGSARFASEVAGVPVINAGDGANQHPSQTLLDLYSIEKTQGSLYDLKIGLVGDLKYGRTVHSLIPAMKYYNPHFYFLAPDILKMPEEYKNFLREKGINYEEVNCFDDILSKVDILYMTRVQKERFYDPMEYENVKDCFVLTREMVEKMKPNARVLHPLPRVNEIAQDVDDDPRAYYFEQARNGLFVRQAIIAKALGIEI